MVYCYQRRSASKMRRRHSRYRIRTRDRACRIRRCCNQSLPSLQQPKLALSKADLLAGRSGCDQHTECLPISHAVPERLDPRRKRLTTTILVKRRSLGENLTQCVTCTARIPRHTASTKILPSARIVQWPKLGASTRRDCPQTDTAATHPINSGPISLALLGS